jgi:hypothetical protein
LPDLRFWETKKKPCRRYFQQAGLILFHPDFLTGIDDIRILDTWIELKKCCQGELVLCCNAGECISGDNRVVDLGLLGCGRVNQLVYPLLDSIVGKAKSLDGIPALIAITKVSCYDLLCGFLDGQSRGRLCLLILRCSLISIEAAISDDAREVLISIVEINTSADSRYCAL